MSRNRIRSRFVAGAASVALAVGMFAGLGPVASTASSHREAPLTAADPQIDNTDVYAFVSPDRPSTVTLISSWIPFEYPAGGPNFFLWATKTNYDINIDNNGDAIPDIIYRWTFKTHYRNANTFLYNTGQVTSLSDNDLNIYQTYDLHKIRTKNDVTTRLLDDAPVVPSDVGDASMPAYNSDLFDAGSTAFGHKPNYSWVGQSDDPFFLDLRVFDLLYSPNLTETSNDSLAGFNVNTMALQVAKKALHGTDPNDAVIGVWSTASRQSMRVEGGGKQSFSGPDVQVSRLGNPLVNEVVVPVGSKDYFNSTKPKNDIQFLGAVQDPELPHLLNAVYGTDVPDSDSGTAGIQRADLIQVFLTGVPTLNQPADVKPSEELRLNMAIPPCSSACSRLGVINGDVAGFPNGRRLSDDIIDISLRVVLGVLLTPHQGLADTIGDGVNANDVSFNPTFPYVAYPHSGSTTNPNG
ncbi:MAG: DUF4331 domain-containing protein [Actinomycetota bacterium]|nr:DUF4331 domain-containing protein [Actinomycetota bacterium]